MLRTVGRCAPRSGTAKTRLRHRHIRVEALEDRSLPAFVTAPSFLVGPHSGVRSDPAAITVGDFNRDGRMDVATANHGSQGISVLLGNGNGTFKPSINVFIGRAPDGILARDLNGDGKLDLVTVNKDSDSVTVLLGTGLGTFKSPVHYAAGNGPVAVAAGDLNGDGFVDLAVADTDGSNVALLFGNGAGKFPTSGGVSTGSNPTSVAIADFNQDNKLDLAVVSGGGFGTVGIKLNSGNGTFTSGFAYDVGFVPHTVVVGRFNNDSIPDLAIACKFPSGDGVGVLLGNGDVSGSFQAANNYSTGEQTPLTLAVVDFDGNGIQDIVTANDQFANNSVSVLMANGTGGFGEPRVFTSGQKPLGVAVGDFNSDGVPDVVTADSGTPVGSDDPAGRVTLLLGNLDGTLAAAPTLIVQGPGPTIATDLTGDGIPDLAVVTDSVDYSGVTVFPGLGDGSFDTRLLTPGMNQPTSVAFGFFNNDSIKDLAVTRGSVGGSLVSILLGNGDGTFGVPTSYAVNNDPKWVVVDDFNGDTKADLAVATGSGVSILLGNGDGTFGTASSIIAGGAATYLASADFNGDQKKDLAVVNGGDNQLSVLFGQGNGSFSMPTTYGTRVGPGSVGVGFFNGDSKPDLAIPTFFGAPGTRSSIAILQNGTNGAFFTRGEYGTDSRPIGIVVADFNGDGKSDLAVANNFADNVFIFPGTGLGTFGPPVEFVVGDRPDWLAAADFNGDGRTDLAVVNGNSSTITLLQTPSTVASHFRVNVIPVTATAGVAFQVSVAALDGNNHLIPGYRGAVSFSSTDGLGTLPATYRFTAADHGIHRFNVTLRTAGAQDIIAHSGAATGIDSISVVPAVANHLKVVSAPEPVAGTPLDVTVMALDRFGNVDPSYRGRVNVYTNDLANGVVLPGIYTFNASDNGVHTFTGGFNLRTAGQRMLFAKALGVLWPVAFTRVMVQGGAAASFSVTGTASATAGVPFTLTVTAKDLYGNVANGFAGTVDFASNDAQAILPAPYTFTGADQGVHAFQATLKTAGSRNVEVHSLGFTAAFQIVEVKPAAVAGELAFVSQPADAFIATPVKPAVTVEVRDAFGNLVPAGVKVNLALGNNPGGAVLGGAAAYTGAGGLATFRNLTLSKKGQGYTLLARAGTGTSPPSSAFTIYAATHLGVTTSTTQTVAGTSFSITVTALDASNQPDPTYAGTVRFTSTDALADLPNDYTFQPGDNGQHVFTVTLKRAGVQTVTVADLLKPTVKKVANVTVSAAAVTQFLISGLPSTVTHDTVRTFTVTALDAYGNKVNNYAGTVQFSNAGGTAILPSPYSFKTADNGRHVFTVTFQTPGAGQSLTVTDQANPLITGTQSGITVV
jgi:FG-GAP-like repeat